MSIDCPCYCNVYAYVVAHFCDSVGRIWAVMLLGKHKSLRGIALSVFTCITVGDPNIKSDLIYRFNPATFPYLSQANIWIFLDTCCGLPCFQCLKKNVFIKSIFLLTQLPQKSRIFWGLYAFNVLKWEVIIHLTDLDKIVDHYWLSIYFHKRT